MWTRAAHRKSVTTCSGVIGANLVRVPLVTTATTTTTMCENQRLQTYKAATIIHVLLADAFLSYILRLAGWCLHLRSPNRLHRGTDFELWKGFILEILNRTDWVAARSRKSAIFHRSSSLRKLKSSVKGANKKSTPAKTCVYVAYVCRCGTTTTWTWFSPEAIAVKFDWLYISSFEKSPRRRRLRCSKQ